MNTRGRERLFRELRKVNKRKRQIILSHTHTHTLIHLYMVRGVTSTCSSRVGVKQWMYKVLAERREGGEFTLVQPSLGTGASTLQEEGAS